MTHQLQRQLACFLKAVSVTRGSETYVLLPKTSRLSAAKFSMFPNFFTLFTIVHLGEVKTMRRILSWISSGWSTMAEIIVTSQNSSENVTSG